MAVIARVIDGSTRGQDVKPLAPGIFEARAQVGGAWIRCAYARWGSAYVALTVFRKKQNRTEPVHVKRAEERWKQWRSSMGAPPGT